MIKSDRTYQLGKETTRELQREENEETLWKILDEITQGYKISLNENNSLNQRDLILADTIISTLGLDKGEDPVSFEDVIMYFNKKCLSKLIDSKKELDLDAKEKKAFREFKRTMPRVGAIHFGSIEALSLVNSNLSFPCFICCEDFKWVVFSRKEIEDATNTVLHKGEDVTLIDGNRLRSELGLGIDTLKDNGFVLDEGLGIFIKSEELKKT